MKHKPRPLGSPTNPSRGIIRSNPELQEWLEASLRAGAAAGLMRPPYTLILSALGEEFPDATLPSRTSLREYLGRHSGAWRECWDEHGNPRS